MRDLEIVDIVAVLLYVSRGNTESVKKEGFEVMSRYGITDGPVAEGADGKKTVSIRGAFVDRVGEIRQRDDSYWRAIPQAVHEWSNGLATPREMGSVLLLYIALLDDGNLSGQVIQDMKDAATKMGGVIRGDPGDPQSRERP